MAKKNKGPASTKREKMSKAQQMTLLAVLLAAIVVGACAVLAIHSVKYIGFYKRVITEKDDAISGYEQVLAATGACRSSNKEGTFSEEDLKKCNPDNNADNIPGTLKYNVLEVLAHNKNLEEVETESGNMAVCYTDDGKRKDYTEEYNKATSSTDRLFYFNRIMACSALRIVPDALPAQSNVEALMASLNEIFNISDWQPESLAPSTNTIDDESGVYAGIGIIPVSFTVESSSDTTLRVLSNLERSIRVFDIQTATIEWAGEEHLDLSASAWAYYTDTSGIKENTKVVKADDAKK